MPNKDIQPNFFEEAKFTCTTCQNEIICGTTKSEKVRIDVCSNCHPFYNGTQNFVNVTGRVEQFKSKFVKKEDINSKATSDSNTQKEINKKNKKEKK